MTEFNKSHIGRRVKNRLGNTGFISEFLELLDGFPVRVGFDNGSISYYTDDGKASRSDDYASITLIEDEPNSSKPVFGVGDTVINTDGEEGVVTADASKQHCLRVDYANATVFYRNDGCCAKDYLPSIRVVRRAQDKVKQVWLSDEDKEAYEQRVSDYKLENFLEGFDDVDLWATFIECWHDAEMLGFAKRGVIMEELKKYSVEHLSKEWAKKFDMHPQHLSDIEVSEIKKAVDDIFL